MEEDRLHKISKGKGVVLKERAVVERETEEQARHEAERGQESTRRRKDAEQESTALAGLEKTPRRTSTGKSTNEKAVRTDLVSVTSYGE